MGHDDLGMSSHGLETNGLTSTLWYRKHCETEMYFLYLNAKLNDNVVDISFPFCINSVLLSIAEIHRYRNKM